MSRYFPWEKGNNGTDSYLPSARIISGLYHAYEGPNTAGKSATMLSLSCPWECDLLLPSNTVS